MPTARGLDRWILLVFLAFTLMLLHPSPDLSFEEAAGLVLTLALPVLRLNVILARLAEDEEFLRQHGYLLQVASNS